MSNLCKCGCKTETNNQFVLGHAHKNRPHSKEHSENISKALLERGRLKRLGLLIEKTAGPCICGCGNFARPGSRFVSGHNGRGVHRPMSEAAKKKLSLFWTGKPGHIKTPEERERLSLSVKRSYEQNPELRKMRADFRLKKWQDPAYRQHISEANSKTVKDKFANNVEYRDRSHAAHRTPEYRQKISNLVKSHWKRELEAGDFTRIKNMIAGNAVRPNKTETKLLNLIKSIDDSWSYVGDGQLIIKRKNPDYFNGANRLIELFGTYWHKGDDPQNRIDFFKQHNYDCLVIWESELEDEANVLGKLRGFV